MTYYDYKVAPAPKRLKRVKGVKTTSDLFSVTLAETINAAAREGWEYLRSESLPVIEEGGFFRRGSEVIETVLVFRRPRETLGPRVAAQREPYDAPETAERVERSPLTPSRREPRLGDAGEPHRPLRPAPRLGPADKV